MVDQLIGRIVKGKAEITLLHPKIRCHVKYQILQGDDRVEPARGACAEGGAVLVDRILEAPELPDVLAHERQVDIEHGQLVRQGYDLLRNELGIDLEEIEVVLTGRGRGRDLDDIGLEHVRPADRQLGIGKVDGLFKAFRQQAHAEIAGDDHIVVEMIIPVANHFHRDELGEIFERQFGDPDQPVRSLGPGIGHDEGDLDAGVQRYGRGVQLDPQETEPAETGDLAACGKVGDGQPGRVRRVGDDKEPFAVHTEAQGEVEGGGYIERARKRDRSPAPCRNRGLDIEIGNAIELGAGHFHFKVDIGGRVSVAVGGIVQGDVTGGAIEIVECLA